MSISSKRLQELTEEKIGEGQSRYLFGKHWKKLYEVMSKEEETLTEEKFREALEKCDFKDPERVGLISLICPPICTPIIDRVMKKVLGELYKFFLYAWYFMFLVTLIKYITSWEWAVDEALFIMILCLVSTSWCFRGWSRIWNVEELIYRTIMKRRE